MMATIDAILAKPTAATLRSEQKQIIGDLKAAVQNGEQEKIIGLRRSLEAYPMRITACEIAATKQALDQVEKSFSEIEADTTSLQLLLKEKVAEIQPLLDAYNDAQTSLQEVQFALSLAKDKKTAAIEKRRELRAKLSNFLTEVSNEFETI